MPNLDLPTEHDSLHILPLSIIPLRLNTLRQKRLIKTARLETVIELYNDAQSGSGQVRPDALAELFDFGGENAGDLQVVKKLCTLHSYDVYSLRLSLRRLGIDVENLAELKLSPLMSDSLIEHMSVFTRPLIMKIYGDSDKEMRSLTDVLRLFMDPDNTVARNNLRSLAQSLDIQLIQIPNFLEDYADVYLSLSYFQKCSDNVKQTLSEFADDLKQLSTIPGFEAAGYPPERLNQTARQMRYLHSEVAHVLETFQRQTDDMWRNITAARYRQLSRLVIEHQEKFGAILCALTVKLAAWQQLSRAAQSQSPQDKAHFIATTLSHGLDGFDNISRVRT